MNRINRIILNPKNQPNNEESGLSLYVVIPSLINEKVINPSKGIKLKK